MFIEYDVFPDTQALVNMTNSLVRGYMNVLVVGPHFTNALPSSILGAAGQLSTRVFLEP